MRSVEATGLSRGTLGQRLEQLLQRRLVVVEEAPSTGGRPPRRFAFNPHAGVVLAADLGATHGRIAVADLGGHTCASRDVELAIAAGPQVVFQLVIELFDEVLAESGHGRGDVSATGIGVPGPVDFAKGRPVRPPIMPGWDDFDIRGWLAPHLPGPVLVDNDVNVMALGEYWRSWRDSVEELLYVKVATGIGAGLSHAVRRFEVLAAPRATSAICGSIHPGQSSTTAATRTAWKLSPPAGPSLATCATTVSTRPTPATSSTSSPPGIRRRCMRCERPGAISERRWLLRSTCSIPK